MTLRPVSDGFVHHTAVPMSPDYYRAIQREKKRGLTRKERRTARKIAKKFERAMMRKLEEIAINRGFDGISYTDIAFDSGRVYKGRGFKKVGAHTLGYNDRAYAVSAAGNYSERKPSDELLEAIGRTFAKGIRFHRIRRNFALRPHSAVSNTACPGTYLKAQVDQIEHIARKRS